jgi:hypothetical protein
MFLLVNPYGYVKFIDTPYFSYFHNVRKVTVEVSKLTRTYVMFLF